MLKEDDQRSMEQSPEEISRDNAARLEEFEAAYHEIIKLLNDAEKLILEENKAEGTEGESN